MSGSPREASIPSARAWAKVRVLPGAGLVGRRGDTLLVVPVLSTSQHEQVRELVELCSRPDPDGQVRVDALRALLDLRASGEMPGFGLLIRTGQAVRAFVHGPVRILVDGDPR